jgi:hypothetical protein
MSKISKLTASQSRLCSASLSRELMHVCSLLGKDRDASGCPLDDRGRHELTRFSLEVQLTLLSLGMTSDHLARIVKSFSK